MSVHQLVLGFVACISTLAFARGGDWQVRSAVYRVPVPPELSRYAEFKLADIKTRERGDSFEIEYTLPRELTGYEAVIRAQSISPDKTELTGQFCRMKCMSDTCQVNYPRLNLSEDVVRDHLVQNGVVGEELESRIQVFRFFDSGDPAGTITFE